jgi:hypothetical protein
MWGDLESGRLSTFEDFAKVCDARQDRMSRGLAQVHREVGQQLSVGDPTPFKRFRRREYLSTVSRMSKLPDDASSSQVLSSEIVITREVVHLAEDFMARGALTFGISDKPDEASVPTRELAEQGYLPLHRARMKMY